MTDEAEYAWAAGFIEADGSFTVQIGRRSGNRSRFLSPRIQVSQYDKRPLMRLVDLCDQDNLKRYTPTLKSNGKEKKYWKISITGRERLLAMVKRIRPHMCAKTEQADLVLEALSIQRERGSGGYTDEEWDRLLEISDEVKTLNARF